MFMMMTASLPHEEETIACLRYRLRCQPKTDVNSGTADNPSRGYEPTPLVYDLRTLPQENLIA